MTYPNVPDGRPSQTLAVRQGTQTLAVRTPFDWPALVAFLGARAVPGVEEVRDDSYRRVMSLPGGSGIVTLRYDADVAPRSGVTAELDLTDGGDMAEALLKCRRLLDLDADPSAIAATLAPDALVGPLLARNPGRRSPGAVDASEMVVRAVLGQQVSVQAARTIAGRLAFALGERIDDAQGSLMRTFPSAAALAEAPDDLFPMPTSRRNTVRAVCRSLAEGLLSVEPGADPAEVRRALLAHRGIGPWTASYIAMRALGDPDAFLPTDLGVRHALDALGQPSDPRSAARLAERWRPWRSYALHHLWASLG